jgi:hypothetical protein
MVFKFILRLKSIPTLDKLVEGSEMATDLAVDLSNNVILPRNQGTCWEHYQMAAKSNQPIKGALPYLSGNAEKTVWAHESARALATTWARFPGLQQLFKKSALSDETSSMVVWVDIMHIPPYHLLAHTLVFRV